ncbi:hypothetical protein NCC78_09560 [Micromonospora phytophila]|uniref:hypothetical protein n=1 Tax=Micromonospora phytophila TaxID=709888 RepID=UPI00202E1B9B|nr:hypothetical protein [Micromonospora phytophila]MCM0674935.1 hypothetical protein [Micromonospora phytophila]
MNSQKATAEKVPVWPRVLAVAALLACTLTAGWSHLLQGNAPGLGVAWWLPAVITAIPVFAVRGTPFKYACLAAGVLLLVLAVFVAFWPIPVALILFVAAAADPQRAPWHARVSVLVGVSLAVIASVAPVEGIYRGLTSPPAGFVVHTSSEFTVTEPAFDRVVQGAASGYGVESMTTVRAPDHEGLSITVQFRPDLPVDGQERLRRHLTEAPGVTKVCSWYRDNHLRSRC